MLKRIKKIIVRILACFIRDKEKRRIFRNTLTTDTIPYPGYSYIMKPFHGNRNSLTIGKYVSIARDVTIGPGNHPLEKFTTSPYIYSHLSKEDLDNKYARPVCIDNDVWIGTKAVILNGVHIHTGAVVGAGAVVTKDVPPYAIVAGVPAKIIKYRFDNNTINALLKSHWWDLPMDIIKKAPLNDTNKAIEYFQNYRNSL